MKAEGKIRHVGLTNFDAKHLQYVTDKGVQIASNQVLSKAGGGMLSSPPGDGLIVSPGIRGWVDYVSNINVQQCNGGRMRVLSCSSMVVVV